MGLTLLKIPYEVFLDMTPKFLFTIFKHYVKNSPDYQTSGEEEEEIIDGNLSDF